MTRVSWLPVLILLLIHLRTTLSLDCVSQVKDCPCSEKEWEERSAFYNCSFSRYTCMLTFNNSLVEACIYNYRVRPGALGCPVIISCYERIAILAIETEFRPCPANKTGCPPTSHDGYSVANLYMYPECIKRSESPRCTDDMQITTEGGKNGSGAEILYITIIAVLTCVIVFAIVAGIIFKKRYRQKLIDYRYRQTPVDNNSAVLELAPSSVLPLVADIEIEEMDNNSAVSELAQSSVLPLVADIEIEEMDNNSAVSELAPSSGYASAVLESAPLSVLPLATDIDIEEIVLPCVTDIDNEEMVLPCVTDIDNEEMVVQLDTDIDNEEMVLQLDTDIDNEEMGRRLLFTLSIEKLAGEMTSPEVKSNSTSLARESNYQTTKDITLRKLKLIIRGPREEKIIKGRGRIVIS